ncbi:transposase [Mesorhizobium sp. M0698]|uniref:transposase n=1 Tax=Mesorhizobium sp. M0698 TaxID=2956987 RepID=UPI00333B9037
MFDEITRQLRAKAIQVKTGTLVDATIIASASEDDEEGHWVKHKGRPAVHGFKAHVGADADTALVEEIAITPANINDGKAGPDALPDNLGEVFADSAYRGNHFGDAVRARGGRPRIVATGMWGWDEAETKARLEAWNQPIHRIRGRIEKIFGTWKRSYGLRRMRWRGLAKAGVQIRLTAIVHNMKRRLKSSSSLWLDSSKNTTDAHTRASEDTADDVGADIRAPFTLEAEKIKPKCFPRTGLIIHVQCLPRFIPERYDHSKVLGEPVRKQAGFRSRPPMDFR